MTRSFYRWLLWLHPPAFRRQFAGEMLWIFDEAAAAEGPVKLIADGFVSLFRQWVLGAGGWKVAVGFAVAFGQLLILSGLAHIAYSPLSQRPLPASLSSADIVFSEGLLPIFVLLVGFIGFLGVLRARTSSRH
jgi:hypothetical protein